MKTQEIRRKFLQYFEKNSHTIIPSSPVLPHDDPTLLFTNAGMNQFKDVFLGESIRDYSRAATAQKCIRVGGKHNDLDNVGHTKRHLTLFEMLGNFSFGDYFKEEAIKFAWEVSTEVFGFDPQRLWPTVFRDDDEAFELWSKYVPANRITRFDEDENFWAMGDTGPCGPCSEIYYDRGTKFGTAANPTEDIDGERYLEFWNLVFMQFNRTSDGIMSALPKKSVDTGAGIERIVALKMDVDNVFETDVLRGLITAAEEVTGKKYNSENAAAFNVIADHIRCLSFAIADGVQPSNVERGYVLRKVLRRAVRYGRQLGMEKPFLADVFPKLIDLMGSDYPELIKNKERIGEILTVEEEAFNRTLQRGGNILNQIIEHARRHGHRITGEDAFKLKDTYGFPLEEVTLIAKDSDLTVDLERYQELEKEARERSRKAHKVTEQLAGENLFTDFADQHGPTEFIGYNYLEGKGKVLAIVVGENFVDKVKQGEEAIIVLDRTPFYAEMGGQIGDTGYFTVGVNEFHVYDTRSPYKGIVAHIGKAASGEISVGDQVNLQVDVQRRQRIANNHTATHLLHWALQQVLGDHATQAGSVVDAERLRFDFCHHKALSGKEVRQIEDLVNAKIRENKTVSWYEMPYKEIQKRDDIKQFFGEKYGDHVRVIDIDYSKELCGGTHTSAVGNIGLFRIAKEGSIAAGIRRIEAVTGAEAEALARQPEEQLSTLGDLLKTHPSKVQERIEKLLEENKSMAAELKGMQQNKLKELAKQLAHQVEMINGIPVVSKVLELSNQELKDLAEAILDEMKSVAVVLGAVIDGRCQLLSRVSDDLVAKGIKANEIIKEVAPIIQGGGGGKANSAQAGGKEPARLEEAVEQARKILSR